jgi:methionine synthase I (cobalamin-dependent)
VVRSVHEDYIKAGADVITANTYASSPLMFHARGRTDLIEVDTAAMREARAAADAAGPAGCRGRFDLGDAPARCRHRPV